MKQVNVVNLLCCTIVIANCSFGTKQAAGQQTALEQELAGEMVFIPAGTFQMGDLSGEGHYDEGPVHSVTVPAFKLGKYEVTVSQFRSFVKATGYRTNAEQNTVEDSDCWLERQGWVSGRNWRNPGYPAQDEQPVVCISWYDAQAFITWLNDKTGGNYRLPSEAEWEFAARASTNTKYSWGDNIGNTRASCNGCGSPLVNARPAPAGSFPANPWGLHDMHGNAGEWVQDCLNDNYAHAPTVGFAWTSGNCGQRGVRGGAWNEKPWSLRSAYRNWFDRLHRANGIGFRLAETDIANRSFGNQQVAQQQRLLKKALAGEMVSIPAGTFRMGDLSGDGYDNEKPVHTVTLPAFRLGKHEVTLAQWYTCMADRGCNGHTPGNWGDYPNEPVIGVSWDDVQSFIDWLNEKTAGNYRLPTEAEWEYAARAGTTTEYSWGDDIGSNRANCAGASAMFGVCGEYYQHTAPVGSFPANAWGLHDMHGNVWEWTEDCWNDSYNGAPINGSAWTNGDCGRRVVRGGSWFDDDPSGLRSAARDSSDRSEQLGNYGFRLAQDE